MIMKKLTCLLVAACIFAVFCGPALADEQAKELPWNRAALYIGAGVQFFDSSWLDNGPFNVGTTVDFEDTLGLDEARFQWYAWGYYRIAPRHKIDVAFVDLSRDNTETIKETIEIGDEVFDVGTRVKTDFDLLIAQASYTYSFFQDDRIDFGASVGVFLLDFDIKVREKELIGVEEDLDFTFPLPVLGLHMSFAITPELFFTQNFRAFYLEVESLTGVLLSYYAGVEWNVWKYVGIGAGINYLNASLEGGDERVLGIKLDGEVEFESAGALVFAKFYLP
jgi:opacity protein-like surface antigen